jgi:hypothetical protein
MHGTLIREDGIVIAHRYDRVNEWCQTIISRLSRPETVI